MKSCGLYLHIPFCKSKCNYCNFCSFSSQEHLFEPYVEALKVQLDYFSGLLKNYRIDTIYFGGGTPSLLDAGLISGLLAHIHTKFRVAGDAEITLEVNPNTWSVPQAQGWKNAGINRLSIGIQSDDNSSLQILGRTHTFEQAEQTIEEAKALGFSNLSADLLLGIPHQTPCSVRRTMRKISKLGLKHISAYGLIVEPGTPLATAVKSGEIVLPEEEISVQIYNAAHCELEKLGFKRYEISNFARPGFECRHNLNYWNRGEFVGIGLAAYSFLDGCHFESAARLPDCLKDPCRRFNIERETPESAQRETIMLRLRCTEGLDLAEFDCKFHTNFLVEHADALEKFSAEGWVEIQNNRLKIKNFEVSNFIISELF